jgi:hypothetical protein
MDTIVEFYGQNQKDKRVADDIPTQFGGSQFSGKVTQRECIVKLLKPISRNRGSTHRSKILLCTTLSHLGALTPNLRDNIDDAQTPISCSRPIVRSLSNVEV